MVTVNHSVEISDGNGNRLSGIRMGEKGDKVRLVIRSKTTRPRELGDYDRAEIKALARQL